MTKCELRDRLRAFLDTLDGVSDVDIVGGDDEFAIGCVLDEPEDEGSGEVLVVIEDA